MSLFKRKIIEPVKPRPFMQKLPSEVSWPELVYEVMSLKVKLEGKPTEDESP